MIDSYWTKWRIKQLAGGEALLAGKWLEDYARWLYGRAWYRCGGDLAAIQRLLEETFVLAAGRLKDCAAGKTPMSEWLLSIYEPLTAGIPTPGKSVQPACQLRKAVGGLLIYPVSETEPYWSQLTGFGQQALAMLSCDEQCLLICRYCRLERPENIAVQYGMDIPKIQTLLYKASHSFRRILEALAGPDAEEALQRGQINTGVLESNLEKIFCTLVLESPSLEFMAQLKERVEAALAQGNTTGWAGKQKIYLGASIAVFIGVTGIFIWFGISGSTENKDAIKMPRNNTVRAKKDISAASSPDAAQDVQVAVQLGMAGDIEGLLVILRTGTFPAQIAAAHYLAQYGDQSAINLLDQAAQKWYAENSTGTNPFIEAITAIENRMRLQARQELQAKVQSLLTRKPTVQETPQPLNDKVIPQEPNIVSKQPVMAAKPEPLVLTEPNVTQQEPNDMPPLLIVHMEPNEPLIIEEANQPAPMEDVNLPVFEEAY